MMESNERKIEEYKLESEATRSNVTCNNNVVFGRRDNGKTVVVD